MSTTTELVARVEQRARTFHLGRALLIVVAALPFLLGWLARWAWRAVEIITSWVVAAVREGWAVAAEQAHKPRGGG